MVDLAITVNEDLCSSETSGGDQTELSLSVSQLFITLEYVLTGS